ncbi:hypothetical protein FORMB_18710 [Formosa sp. Hel1_33_131]|uniref:hypothetical protein n=1 Tax=Formosa sp. Hel1_33_131 TaxID=1336794 RepID=UPI00084E2AC0|nr:hypothetical protein [Formosa sp. Hel1_33_131]AOR28901.1 hypothetical protein FORMB_18710 [Formosa sp. Hel1_33_131]
MGSLHEHFRAVAYEELKALHKQKKLSSEAMLFFFECSSHQYKFEKNNGIKNPKKIYRFCLN